MGHVAKTNSVRWLITFLSLANDRIRSDGRPLANWWNVRSTSTANNWIWSHWIKTSIRRLNISPWNFRIWLSWNQACIWINDNRNVWLTNCIAYFIWRLATANLIRLIANSVHIWRTTTVVDTSVWNLTFWSGSWLNHLTFVRRQSVINCWYYTLWCTTSWNWRSFWWLANRNRARSIRVASWRNYSAISITYRNTIWGSKTSPTRNQSFWSNLAITFYWIIRGLTIRLDSITVWRIKFWNNAYLTTETYNRPIRCDTSWRSLNSTWYLRRLSFWRSNDNYGWRTFRSTGTNILTIRHVHPSLRLIAAFGWGRSRSPSCSIGT